MNNRTEKLKMLNLNANKVFFFFVCGLKYRKKLCDSSLTPNFVLNSRCLCEVRYEVLFFSSSVLAKESSRVLRARQQTQARFESFLQDAVADDK